MSNTLALRTPDAELHEEISTLRRRIERLEEDLETARREARMARQEIANSQAGLKAVRRQLEPMHTALRALFGELDAANITVEGAAVAPRVNAVWESWKTKLGGKCAEFIDLLLLHTEMSTAQLMAAAHCAKQTVYDTTSKMSRSGILEKNGSNYRLKAL